DANTAAAAFLLSLLCFIMFPVLLFRVHILAIYSLLLIFLIYLKSNISIPQTVQKGMKIFPVMIHSPDTLYHLFIFLFLLCISDPFQVHLKIGNLRFSLFDLFHIFFYPFIQIPSPPLYGSLP